jgi:hypothetical protein
VLDCRPCLTALVLTVVVVPVVAYRCPTVVGAANMKAAAEKGVLLTMMVVMAVMVVMVAMAKLGR